MDCNSLSASSTKCYNKDCRFKYYLDKHLRLPQPKKWATENGTFCHSIFEDLAKQMQAGEEPTIRKNWKKILLDAYRNEREIKNKFGQEERCPPLWILSPKALAREKDCEHCRWLKKDKCLITGQDPKEFAGCPNEEFETSIWLIEKVLNDNSQLNPLNKKILQTEQAFALHVDDGTGEKIKVTGFIDLVNEIDADTIEICDYKTGKHVQSYAECIEDPQLLYYHLAARELYPQYPNVFISIWYLQRRMMTFSFGPEDEVKTRKMIVETYHKIKNDVFPVRRCDRSNGMVHFDWVCQGICSPEVCQVEYEKMIQQGCISEGKPRDGEVPELPE